MTIESSSKSVVELKSQVKRVDTEVSNLNSKVKLLENLLMKNIVEQGANSDF